VSTGSALSDGSPYSSALLLVASTPPSISPYAPTCSAPSAVDLTGEDMAETVGSKSDASVDNVPVSEFLMGAPSVTTLTVPFGELQMMLPVEQLVVTPMGKLVQIQLVTRKRHPAVCVHLFYQHAVTLGPECNTVSTALVLATVAAEGKWAPADARRRTLGAGCVGSSAHTSAR